MARSKARRRRLGGGEATVANGAPPLTLGPHLLPQLQCAAFAKSPLGMRTAGLLYGRDRPRAGYTPVAPTNDALWRLGTTVNAVRRCAEVVRAWQPRAHFLLPTRGGLRPPAAWAYFFLTMYAFSPGGSQAHSYSTPASAASQRNQPAQPASAPRQPRWASTASRRASLFPSHAVGARPILSGSREPRQAGHIGGAWYARIGGMSLSHGHGALLQRHLWDHQPRSVASKALPSGTLQTGRTGSPKRNGSSDMRA